ncbi:hypothetical protein [Leptolyngbya sp. CCY15150]|uniref:hypothetical protein n=1 Tax=Leptolyngbya sp. CCY15150 TaxID=2767772 RepID=UPI00194DF786|nr:hypothetical protein [Leptolyngbya sp. CCY15150]
MLLTILMLITGALGLRLGYTLAQQGLTAENAIQHYQRQVYIIASVALGIGTFLGVLLTAGRHSPWLPSLLLLYAGAYFWQVILLLCCFCTGLLMGLECPGWRDRSRLRQLILFLAISLSAMVVLVYQNLPVTHLVRSPRLSDDIVLQTTPYSCSAATIATLSRIVHPSAQTTERDVVELAGTSRQGTSTMAELQAMKALGLAPRYERGLTLEDLIDRQQLAVLHVIEPVVGARIQHAIALLAIDVDYQVVIVGNPLYGLQVKTFEELTDGYWIRAAVFVTVSSLDAWPSGGAL